MIVFATSDKGGTGRSVTSCNVAYRRALQGSDVCYLDFDFGSPTAGAIFNIDGLARGWAGGGGLHDYLSGATGSPQTVDVWRRSDREGLRGRPPGAGRLMLLPGDQAGGEFPIDGAMTDRCAELFLRLEEEFDVVLVDLSAGRSYAAELVLTATSPAVAAFTSRWLIFHRWTRQHIIAAAGLAFADRGILMVGLERGHSPDFLEDSIRFVRTAVLSTDSPRLGGLRGTQAAWLRDCDRDLRDLAAKHRLGRTVLLAEIPLDPVLQWREQIITDADIHTSQIADAATGEAFARLAKRLTEDSRWEGL